LQALLSIQTPLVVDGPSLPPQQRAGSAGLDDGWEVVGGGFKVAAPIILTGAAAYIEKAAYNLRVYESPDA
jgi:hypothetical protein